MPRVRMQGLVHILRGLRELRGRPQVEEALATRRERASTTLADEIGPAGSRRTRGRNRFIVVRARS